MRPREIDMQIGAFKGKILDFSRAARSCIGDPALHVISFYQSAATIGRQFTASCETAFVTEINLKLKKKNHRLQRGCRGEVL